MGYSLWHDLNSTKIRSILTINERLAKLQNIYTKGIYAAIKKRKSQCSLCADMQKSAGI